MAADVRLFGPSEVLPDVRLLAYAFERFNVYLYAGWSTLPDVVLQKYRFDEFAAQGGGGFPTQFSGGKIKKTSSTIELCMVAEADAPSGMGGVVKINKNGTKYAFYLVETTDPNASPIRIRTTAGTKAVRLKT